jgi:hypothetical protein
VLQADAGASCPNRPDAMSQSIRHLIGSGAAAFPHFL